MGIVELSNPAPDFYIQKKMARERPEQSGKTTRKNRSDPGSNNGSKHSVFFVTGAIILGAFILTGVRKIGNSLYETLSLTRERN